MMITKMQTRYDNSFFLNGTNHIYCFKYLHMSIFTFSSLKWSRSFRDVIKLCLQKDPSKRPTCEDLLNHRHFKRLSDDNFLEARREQIKAELCNMIDDVGKGARR